MFNSISKRCYIHTYTVCDACDVLSISANRPIFILCTMPKQCQPSDESNEKFVWKSTKRVERLCLIVGFWVYPEHSDMCGIEAIRRCYRFA